MTQTSKSPVSPRDKAAHAAEQAVALYQEGVALHQAGQLDDAETVYRRALAYAPKHAGALQMLGVLNMQRGVPAEAVTWIKRSLSSEPRNPQALNNLGLALLDLNRLDEALETLRLAVEVQPESPSALGNLGRALRKRKYFKEAVEVYRKAIELAPDRPGLLSALGAALAASGDYKGAVEAHDRALALAPERADLRNNLAHAHRIAGENAKAEEAFREAIKLDPSQGEYHLGLGRQLNAQGRYGEAINSYRDARDNGAGSTKFELALMFYQNHVVENDPRQSLVDARSYAQRRSKGVVPFTKYANVQTTDRPVRVGWVSPDFKSHPVGRFLDAVMHELDPKRLEMYAYSEVDLPHDPIQISIRESIPRWCSISAMTDEEVAHRIRRDRIDVLIDLTGHTAMNRLGVFAFKPAPVSVTWLGYFATTGYDTIDYVLCNEWLVPEDEEDQWAEKPWRLPDTHWCYTVPKADVPVVETPALASGTVTFGSYNNFEKINEATATLWAEAVNAVPNSRLLLRSSLQNLTVRDALIKRFGELGLSGDRLIVDSDPKNYEDHLASYGLLDIALDPFPYNGGTTTTEALYMGVPVLTLHGDRFVAHLAETNLQSARLKDWVAADRADFVAKAKAFATDLPALNTLRLGLRDRVLASRLFDAKAFARDLEDAFTGMWAKWCADQVNVSAK